MVYRVFISHGWHDRWIARQMARIVQEDAKAEPFIDIFDVKKGDRIEERIFEELPRCRELVVLLSACVRAAEAGGHWKCQRDMRPA